MPDQDPPEIFGMHSNADITFQMNTTTSYIDMILSTISDEEATRRAIVLKNWSWT